MLGFVAYRSTTLTTTTTPNDIRHAFQSLLWNLAASERVKLYGRDGVVEGDLVFPQDSAAVEADAVFAEPAGEIDSAAAGALAAVDGGAAADTGDGEGEEDPEAKRAKKGKTSLPPVHVVTKKDVEEGKFRLTDVVLPMPG